MIEVREVLRCWLDGEGLRTVAQRAGVDRKTARRYVAAAQQAGLERSAGWGAVDDELVAAVVSAVRPERPNGHGAAWESLLGWEDTITGVGVGEGATGRQTAVAGEGRGAAGTAGLLGAVPHVAPVRDRAVRVPGEDVHGAGR